MILADLSIALITAGMVVLFLTGAIQVWHIYIAMALRAIGQAFHYPAMLSAVPMIVPEKQLSRAAGLNQILYGATGIAGPPAGALLLGILPMEGVLAVDIVTAVIAVGCLIPILIPQPARLVSAVKTSVVTEIISGFRYIWTWRGLTIIIGLYAILTVLLYPPFILMPILVTEHLGGDVLKLGWLESAFGFGMIAGGLTLGVWGGFKRRIITSLWGIILCGIATIGLGFTDMSLFFLGVASNFFIGFGLSIADGPIMATLQAIVAKDIQGRIFSLLGSLSSAMTPLGLAFAGPLADTIGIHALYIIAGALTLITGIVSFLIPPLMKLEEKPGEN
jgi:DHA3 family macrolide efflux protein-like MFS transporter